MPAARRFADNSIIPYNLACYCSQLKQPTEARAWLDRAVALGDATEPWRMANQDPDLQPLMEKIDDYCW